LDFLGLLGSEGARTGAGGRRGESGTGAGAATTTRRRCGRSTQSGRALRGVARAQGEPQWVKVRVETGHARGARRSPARRHGRWRARRPRAVGATATGFQRRAQVDRGRGVPSPWQPCARPTWSRRGHGGAAFLGTAASDGVGTKMDQRPGLASRVTAHACWGARLREGVMARMDAHTTRTRRERADTARRRPKQGGVLRLDGVG
jgi:hypothetical protein